jgi:hypothetical protein
MPTFRNDGTVTYRVQNVSGQAENVIPGGHVDTFEADPPSDFTRTDENLYAISSVQEYDNLRAVKWDFTSDATGNVSGQEVYSASGIPIGVRFIPGNVSDLYDVIIKDSHNTDILQGVGANRSSEPSGSANYRAPLTSDGVYPPPLVEEPLRLYVANAGNAKKGAVVLYLSK